MEWSRVKSIMIGIFFIVNVYLFVSYLGTMKTSVEVDDKTVKNTVVILGNNNVVIDENIIPRKTQDMKIFDVTNRFESPAAAAAHYRSVAEKEHLNYFTESERIAIDDDAFGYQTNYPLENGGYTEVTAVSAASRLIAQLELAPALDLVSNAAMTENGYAVTFYQVFEGHNIFDAYLTIVLSDESTIIYGKNWLSDEMTGGGICQVRTAAEILVNYAVLEERTATVTINAVKLGYFVGNRNGIKSTVTVVPVWMLETDTDGTRYFDARNGDLLE